MCGIVGYWHRGRVENSVVKQMASQLRHRGPDDAGVWLDVDAGLALAHQRLSIIDLSFAGHQPMHSKCGRFVLVFNGEIYNHLELRKELEMEKGHIDWRGHSDTETLLAGLHHWGIENTLTRLNGMFAFCLWDKKERTLFLARDRMGEKPLYYGHSHGIFLFGSELKSLQEHPEWHGTIDRGALKLFMRFSYIPSPWSIYKGIYKLPPATYIVVREQGQSVSNPLIYWNLKQIITKQRQDKLNKTPKELTDELEKALLKAVHNRMIADVPLGAFLSGGIDSSTIVALMQAQSTQPINTFTIGFQEKEHNEAIHAKAIANFLATNHTELYVTPKETMAVIPRLPAIWDEPFSDSSQIPTLLISELAKKHVTVSLSGDGGDELFYGYHRYIQSYQIWRILKLIPSPMRILCARLMQTVPKVPLEAFFQLLPERFRISHLADRLPKLAEIVKENSAISFYLRMISHWKQPDDIVLGEAAPPTIFNLPEQHLQLDDLRQHMMYFDTMTYLPDDILTKVDRASMAVSLEARAPFLDHRLVEFAWNIPISLKYRKGKGKWLLHQVLNRYIPEHLTDRPKMGFGVPIEYWLRGPLRDWAEDLLSEKRLKDEGYFNPLPIRKMWKEHSSGLRRWHYYLWDVLMFQAWLRLNKH